MASPPPKRKSYLGDSHPASPLDIATMKMDSSNNLIHKFFPEGEGRKRAGSTRRPQTAHNSYNGLSRPQPPYHSRSRSESHFFDSSQYIPHTPPPHSLSHATFPSPDSTIRIVHDSGSPQHPRRHPEYTLETTAREENQRENILRTRGFPVAPMSLSPPERPVTLNNNESLATPPPPQSAPNHRDTLYFDSPSGRASRASQSTDGSFISARSSPSRAASRLQGRASRSVSPRKRSPYKFRDTGVRAMNLRDTQEVTALAMDTEMSKAVDDFGETLKEALDNTANGVDAIELESRGPDSAYRQQTQEDEITSAPPKHPVSRATTATAQSGAKQSGTTHREQEGKGQFSDMDSPESSGLKGTDDGSAKTGRRKMRECKCCIMM